DLERADPVSRRDDHVVGASAEPEVAVLVDVHAVAGPPGEVARCRVLAQIAGEERRDGRRVDDELAVLDADVDARKRSAHRAGPDRLAGAEAGHLPGLGLPVPIADLNTSRVTPRLERA